MTEPQAESFAKTTMKIATWNINGIKARLDTAKTWLASASPDIACLQEIKCVDEAFPKSEFEDLGYNVAVHGQKGFNGVALLSKLKFDEVAPRLAGDPDDVQARYLEAVVSVPSGVLRIVNIYLPNGNPAGTEKFAYKLAWMTRLKSRIASLLINEEPMVIAGDFNVIPTPDDVYNPAAWVDDALFRPESAERWRTLLPGAQVETIASAGHWPHEEEPEGGPLRCGPACARKACDDAAGICRCHSSSRAGTGDCRLTRRERCARRRTSPSASSCAPTCPKAALCAWTM